MTSSTQVFARTAKGDLEFTGARRLSAGLINVLSLVDGESSVAELSARSGLSRSVLETALEILLEDGMVKLGLQKMGSSPPSGTPPNPEFQSASKPDSRDESKSQEQNLSPATDFLGSMMRAVQHDLTSGKQGASDPLARPLSVSPGTVSKPQTAPAVGSGKNKPGEPAQPKRTDAKASIEAENEKRLTKETKAKAREQELARNKAALEAKARAERYAKLKSEAESKTKSREIEFLAADAKAKAEVEARLRADAEAKAEEDERRRLALHAETRVQAAAAEAKLKADAEAKARQEEARLKAEAEAKAREEERRRAALQAEVRAQAVAAEAKFKAEAEATAQEEGARRHAEEEARSQVEMKAQAEAEYQARLKAEAEARAKEEERRRLAMQEETRAQAAVAEAEAKTQEGARLQAEMKAQAEAEYQARLKAEAEAAAKEEEGRRLALEAQARAQTAAAEAKLKSEAEAREREEKVRRRAEEEARVEAEAKARADADYQARLKMEKKTHREAEAELTQQEQAHRAAEEARIERTVAAKNKGELAASESDFDPFGLPNLPMSAEENDAPDTPHPYATRMEPVLDSSIEPPDAVEQDLYPDLDDKRNKIPTRGFERGGQQPGEISHAQRGPEVLRRSSEFTRPTKARRAEAGIPWGKVVAIAFLSLIVIALAGLPFIPQMALKQDAERVLTAGLGEAVIISSSTVELFPRPLARFEGVKIGEPEMVRVSEIKAAPDIQAWLNGTKNFKAVELGVVTLRPDPYERIYEWLLAARTRLKLPVGRIVIPAMDVTANDLGLKTVKAELELIPAGGLRKVVFTSNDGQLIVNLDPQDSYFQLALSAQAWRLPGTDFDMETLNAAGRLKKNEFIIEDINGRAYGGRIDGKALLRWSDRWKLNGTFKVDGIDIERFPAVPVVSRGMLALNGSYETTADASANLLSRLKVKGKFSVQDGKLSGIDIARVLDESPKDIFGGMTPFKTLDGIFQSSGKGHELREIRLAGGSLSASGQASLSPTKELSGRLTASLNIGQRRMQETLYLSGTATEPRFRVVK